MDGYSRLNLTFNLADFRAFALERPIGEDWCAAVLIDEFSGVDIYQSRNW
jgi:hypothetical protein